MTYFLTASGRAPVVLHQAPVSWEPVLAAADLHGFEPELAHGLVNPQQRTSLYKFMPVAASHSSVVSLHHSTAEILESAGVLPQVVNVEEIVPELHDERHLGLVGALSFAGMILEAPGVDSVAIATKVFPHSLVDVSHFERGKHGAAVASVDNNRTRKEFEGRQITKLLQAFGLEAKAFSGYITARFKNSGTLFVDQEGSRINFHVTRTSDWDALVETGFAEILSTINGRGAGDLDAETRWALNTFDSLDFVAPRGGDVVSLNKSVSTKGESSGQSLDFDLFQRAYLAYLHTTYLETQIKRDFDLLGQSLSEFVKGEGFASPQFEMGQPTEDATTNPFNVGPVTVRSVPEMLLELASRLPTASPGTSHLAFHIANHLMGQIELGYYG